MSTVGDLSPENTIEGASDGTPIGNKGDHLLVQSKINPEQMLVMISLLYDIKEELQKMNMHLSYMTEEEVE